MKTKRELMGFFFGVVAVILLSALIVPVSFAATQPTSTGEQLQPEKPIDTASPDTSTQNTQQALKDAVSQANSLDLQATTLTAPSAQSTTVTEISPTDSRQVTLAAANTVPIYQFKYKNPPIDVLYHPTQDLFDNFCPLKLRQLAVSPLYVFDVVNLILKNIPPPVEMLKAAQEIMGNLMLRLEEVIKRVEGYIAQQENNITLWTTMYDAEKSAVASGGAFTMADSAWLQNYRNAMYVSYQNSLNDFSYGYKQSTAILTVDGKMEIKQDAWKNMDNTIGNIYWLPMKSYLDSLVRAPEAVMLEVQIQGANHALDAARKFLKELTDLRKTYANIINALIYRQQIKIAPDANVIITPPVVE
ncbi:MAG TPA: hypothetical protein PLO78_04830 [Candidatus Omnitrophota bacterium]|nr:hypothetical protein [Candidatus Omnitrophota bacterium]